MSQSTTSRRWRSRSRCRASRTGNPPLRWASRIVVRRSMRRPREPASYRRDRRSGVASRSWRITATSRASSSGAREAKSRWPSRSAAAARAGNGDSTSGSVGVLRGRFERLGAGQGWPAAAGAGVVPAGGRRLGPARNGGVFGSLRGFGGSASPPKTSAKTRSKVGNLGRVADQRGRPHQYSSLHGRVGRPVSPPRRTGRTAPGRPAAPPPAAARRTGPPARPDQPRVTPESRRQARGRRSGRPPARRRGPRRT